MTVSAASPAIATTPSPTTVTLSALTLPILLIRPLYPAAFARLGTITFTLFQNWQHYSVDTETVTVSGNGRPDTTPTGFSTADHTGTVTGTYQWDASYDGDPSNNPVSAR